MVAPRRPVRSSKPRPKALCYRPRTSVSRALTFVMANACAACASTPIDPGSVASKSENGGTAGTRTCTDQATERVVTGVRIFELAAFQAVKVPLVNQMVEVVSRKADIVAGRPALFRAYVVPEPGWVPRIVRARLTLTNSDADGATHELTFTRTVTLRDASIERDLDTSYNFEVLAEAITNSTKYAVGLFETEACPPESSGSMARFPKEGLADLRARSVGEIHVQLVPVLVQGPNGPLLPDTTGPQIEIYRKSLFRLFPATAVELSVRAEPVPTTATSMQGVLDEIAALREAEKPASNLSYFGLVRFTDQIEQYCTPSCVLGGALDGDMNHPTAGTAVGIGYSGGSSAGTLAHELGHVYGQAHAPCGVDGDPNYPYRGGLIGSWGFDILDHQLVDPMKHLDFMSYCKPIWVSDYTFGRLQTYLARLNGFEAIPGPPQMLQSLRNPRFMAQAQLCSNFL